MQTPATNNTAKPTSAARSGSGATKRTEVTRIELDPWEIDELKIGRRGDEFVTVETATDAEFDAWVKTNAIQVKENGIEFWSFDDRCRLINHVLGHGGVLEFADGSRIPQQKKTSESEKAS